MKSLVHLICIFLFKHQLKGNQDATLSTPIINCKYVTSYFTSLSIQISSLELNQPTYQPLETCNYNKVYCTPIGGQLQGPRFHTLDDKFPSIMSYIHRTKVFMVSIVQKIQINHNAQQKRQSFAIVGNDVKSYKCKTNLTKIKETTIIKSILTQ